MMMRGPPNKKTHAKKMWTPLQKPDISALAASSHSSPPLGAATVLPKWTVAQSFFFSGLSPVSLP